MTQGIDRGITQGISQRTPAAQSANAAIIEVDGVSKSFDGGERFAVREVTLSIPAGQFVAIIGDSGSGKTTLLKMINRLIEADRGTLSVSGRPVGDVPAHELRRHIGYVFQEVGLFPHLTVGENIGIVPTLLGWPPVQTAARIEELIELVGLGKDYLARMPVALSGGQRQRVGVARALAARPPILLMDEPFGALDPVTRDRIGTECRRLHDALGLTTLMVTHDVMEAVLLADRIVVMKNGAVAADGTPHELLLDHPEPGVRMLMDMPRRHAERVSALMDAGPKHG